MHSQAQQLGHHLLEAAAGSLADQGITQIALYGAGRHTRPIVRQPWTRFGITVRLIIDDQPVTAAMGGVPILQTQAVELPEEVGAIVVSSKYYQHQMYERACAAFGDTGVQIIKLYDDDDASYEPEQTIDRLRDFHSVNEQDATWLVENRVERHDALLPMLPPARTELHLRRYELAGEVLERIGGRSIADLACGTGYGATIVGAGGDVHYIGVDIDARAIEYADRRYGNESRRYICSSALSAPIKDDAVDVVASFETIEHIEDTIGLCAQYARVLKPDGLLVVSTPNKLGPTPFHVHDFDMQSFLEALSSHFEVVELIGQLPIDDVFDPNLPPGMWRVDLSETTADCSSPNGQRPDFLIAIAKHRGAQHPTNVPR